MYRSTFSSWPKKKLVTHSSSFPIWQPTNRQTPNTTSNATSIHGSYQVATTQLTIAIFFPGIYLGGFFNGYLPPAEGWNLLVKTTIPGVGGKQNLDYSVEFFLWSCSSPTYQHKEVKYHSVACDFWHMIDVYSHSFLLFGPWCSNGAALMYHSHLLGNSVVFLLCT